MPKEILAKSALHYHEKPTPCNWDLNIYRGCEHGCRYCFAQYSHDYLNSDDFFGDIHVKVNIAEQLDKELGKKKWRKERINIGGVTDSYQPLEKQYRLMPEVLETVRRHRNPILIPTKSTLIFRDMELIEKIAGLTSVDIVASISTLDEEIRAVLEPGAAASMERLEMLSEFRKIGCETTILMMPVVPWLTARKKNIESIFRLARQHNVGDIVYAPLGLRGKPGKRFLAFIERDFPRLLSKYLHLYKDGGRLPQYYRRSLSRFVEEMKAKYGFSATRNTNDESV